MSNEELCTAYQESKDHDTRSRILEELYLQNIRLIEKIARQYSDLCDREDLMQEAFFAVRRAAELWRPDGGANFATFAFKLIRQAMRRYMDDCSGTIRITSGMRDLIFEYRNLCNDFAVSRGRAITDPEICFFLSVTPEKLDRIKRAEGMLRLRMTSEMIAEDLSLIEVIADPEDPIEAKENEIQQEQLRKAIWEAVDTLDDKEREVLRMRYQQGITLNEIGEEIGVSACRVQQIEKEAFRKLRAPSRARSLIPFLEDMAEHYGYKHSGMKSFETKGSSSVELAILAAEREEERRRGRQEAI